MSRVREGMQDARGGMEGTECRTVWRGDLHPPPLSQSFIIIYYELMKGIIKYKTWRGLSSSPSLTGNLPFGKRQQEESGNRVKIENRGKGRKIKQAKDFFFWDGIKISIQAPSCPRHQHRQQAAAFGWRN